MRAVTPRSVRAALRISILLLASAGLSAPIRAQSPHFRLFEPGSSPNLPRVVANDNRTPAGTWRNGVLHLDLEVVLSDWRVETEEGPGLRVVTIAEQGQPPTVPGPLIRAETGTRVRTRVQNSLSDSTITVFGLQRRPVEQADSLVVPPGQSRTVTFQVGEPGTYYYWVRLGSGIPPNLGEEEQLAGALVVDPTGGSPPDRVFVINIFWTPVDSTVSATRSLEALAINGKSWPHTERLRPSVGDTLRWRIINASVREHPMHLHGFYYDVTATGTAHRDDPYAARDRRAVVTETMAPGTTMTMEWIPRRPGNWLFHCHLSFHVSPAVRLPGTMGSGHGEHDVHMGGLVLGVEVQPGPTDLVAHGDPRHITLRAMDASADSLERFRFHLVTGSEVDQSSAVTIGPLLVLNQHQTTYAKVENQMSVPTSIHWHGLELESWSDGVPGWSASDGRISPVIKPGESFTYVLSLMRPGTFIYHSHLDDIRQLTSGLYGGLVVLPPGETHDPRTDHVYVVGWRNASPRLMSDLELNGRGEQPEMHAVVGESHRIRLINIAPAGEIAMRMWRDSTSIPIRARAKDGADLPDHQQLEVEVTPRFGVGETADFTFTPMVAGSYELEIGYSPRYNWRQRWVVASEASGIQSDDRLAYFGQPQPGMLPVRFAPGIVSTDAIELNGAFTPDGREFFFTRLIDGIDTIHHTERDDVGWTPIEPLMLFPERAAAVAVDMAVSPDGEALYFLGQHAHPYASGEPGYDIWVSRRIDGLWSTAEVVPPPVSGPSDEIYPVVVGDGSLYFTSNREGSFGPRDVYRSQRLPDGTFAEPVSVGAPINGEYGTGDTFVSPDESYAVFASRRPEGYGQGDLYVSFRREDGGWGDPVNLGPTINTDQTEYCPMVTPDGKYLFFSRRWGATWEETTAGDVFWVDASVLERYRR